VESISKAAIAMNLAIRWGVFAIFLSKALSFSTTLIQSNILGASGYGSYGLILTTVSLFGIVAQGSLGSAAASLLSRNIALCKTGANEILGAILAILVVLSCIACGALFLASGALARAVFRDAEMVVAIRLASFTVCILAAQSVIEGLLSGLHSFRARNGMSIMQSLSFLALSVVLTPRYSVLGALLAFTASNGVSLIYALINLIVAAKARHLKPRIPASTVPYFEVLAFIAPMVLNSVLVIGTSWFVTSALAISKFGFSELGIFTASTQARTLLLALPFLLHSTYGPLMAAAHAEKNGANFKSIFLDCYRGTFVACVPAAALIIVFSESAIAMFGAGFASGGMVLSLSCLLSVVMAIANLYGATIQATGGTNRTILPNIALSMISCIAAPLFIEQFGASGLVMALLVAQIAQAFLLFRQEVKMNLELPHPLSAVIPLALLACVAALRALPGIYVALLAALLTIITLLYSVANSPTFVYERLFVLAPREWLWRTLRFTR
jgi:O-antigen/teichoic acid export membrane protein